MQYLNIEKNTITQKCSSFKMNDECSVHSSISCYRYKDNYYKLLFCWNKIEQIMNDKIQ